MYVFPLNKHKIELVQLKLKHYTNISSAFTDDRRTKFVRKKNNHSGRKQKKKQVGPNLINNFRWCFHADRSINYAELIM